MTHDEMIAILVAHRDGRRIQFQYRYGEHPWCDYQCSTPPNEWNTVNYRIKPNLVCKTTLEVRGFPIYVEGGPETAKLLEEGYRKHFSENFGTPRELKALDKEPREEFELRPV